MKTLIVEKRGCDFWKDSQESRESDLQNFRLFGYISKNKKRMIEITTHAHKKSKYSKFYIVKTWVAMDFYDKKGMCWGDAKNSGFVNSGMACDVLQYINEKWGTHFSKLKIVDRL